MTGLRIAAATLFAIAGITCGTQMVAGQELNLECPDLAPAEHRRGSQLFADFCSRCHRAEDLATVLRSGPDPDEAVSKMTLFLARHGSCDPIADAAIVRYLLALKSNTEDR